MFEGIFLEREIKEKLSVIKEMDEDMYAYLINKMITFNKFGAFKKAIKQTIKRYLVRVIGLQKVPIREYPIKFIDEYRKRITTKELVESVNCHSPRKKIIYVAGLPTFYLMRQSIYLRKAGYETILLMERNLSLINIVEKYFDKVYVVNSIYALYYILKNANPYLIHVQGTTRLANHFGILAKLLSKSKVVFNFYDIPSTTIAKEDIPDVWDKEEVELDFFSEKFACERCDGLIYSYSPKVEKILQSRYSINSPMLEFHSYTCDEFMRNNTAKYSDGDGKIHLVYGGNVVPTNLPERFVGDCQFHSLIEKVTSRGIYFDIYVMAARGIKKDYGDYVLIADKNPFFSFKKGILLDEATMEFSKYDFGCMIYPFYNKEFGRGTNIMEEHVRMRLPDKFFTYLEAGLPVLVSEELRSIADLVREHEMGIVVSQKDLDNLSEIINNYDREKLRANVKKAREDLSMKRHIGRLIAFYERIVENKKGD